MKRLAAVLLLCFMILFVFAGCQEQAAEAENMEQPVMMGNPWSDWNSVEEAEAAVGFSFGLPDDMANGYTAEVFRTMNSELLEIVYQNENAEVCVRKQAGEGQDISGDYNEYASCTEKNDNGGKVTVYERAGGNAGKILVSYQGYSWSIVLSEEAAGDCAQDFIDGILK